MGCEEERIKNELVAGSVKLWKPPYFGVVGKENALHRLAASLAATLHIEHATTAAAIEILQRNALDKLRSRGKLLEEIEIRIPAGLPGEVALDGTSQMEDNGPSTDFYESCLAEKVEISYKSLKLHSVNPNLTVAVFYKQLRDMINVSSVKLVCQGVSLNADDNSRLADRIKHPKGAASLLCLIGTNENLVSSSPDDALVQSICVAASKLQGETGFDVTDAKGNLVSMKEEDRIALLKALGLHAIGNQRMDAGELESSLIFLLQADQEWNSLNGTWASKVDNFGRLQLDISWIYLQLECLDKLEDTTERLERAELVLRKQVHPNFLTLALVQAEQNMPVPAVSFIFVRLFLLQAVAFHHKGNSSKAKERLDWAEYLAQSLRAVSPPSLIAKLCEVTKVSKNQAISALRRTNGDINRAAELASTDKENFHQSERRRKTQTILGRCVNGKDFVDLEKSSQLQTALSLEGRQLVASGLLRLSNNQLDRAMDIYQETNRDHFLILRRVAELDQQQGVSPMILSKRGRIDDLEVDEVAVMQLVSMGITSTSAKQALRQNRNNVERALVWLTTRSTDATPPSSHPPPAAMFPETMAHPPQGNDGMGADNEVEGAGFSGGEGVTGDEQALNLLQRVLGEVLSNQNQGNDENLGDSLDEEWSYIVAYRKVVG